MIIGNCAQDWKKTDALTLLALLKDHQNPGCFSKELSDLIDQNDLPKLNLDGFIPSKVDSHAMSSEAYSDVFLTPIRMKSTSAERSLSSTICTMTVLSNHLDNDPDLVPINQQPSHKPLPSLASTETSYVPFMSTSVVPFSLPVDSPHIGSHYTRFASEATNIKQSRTIAIVHVPMSSLTVTGHSAAEHFTAGHFGAGIFAPGHFAARTFRR